MVCTALRLRNNVIYGKVLWLKVGFTAVAVSTLCAVQIGPVAGCIVRDQLANVGTGRDVQAMCPLIEQPEFASHAVPHEVRCLGRNVNPPYCAMYNLTQGRYVAPFVILTLQGLTLELKEGNNGRVHHGTTIQAGVFTIHL